jgi:DNA-binding MltR family transcriptional regulator
MAKIRKPKALGAEDLGVQILGSIDAEFRDAEDRVMAVVGAAYLDSILEQLLRAAFLNDDEEADRLLAPDRPIGANGARYQLAYCLGLIDADQRDDLKTIAKVRNLFAHNYSVASLEDERAKSLVKGLHFAERREAIRKSLSSRSRAVTTKPALGVTATEHRSILRDAVFELFVALLPKVRDVRRADHALWFGGGGTVGA